MIRIRLRQMLHVLPSNARLPVPFSAALPMAFLVALCLLAPPGAFAAVSHPLDPLEDFEIIGAAQILLDAGAAKPGAVFQSVDLREPPKSLVLSYQPGSPIPRSATVFFRQDKKSYKSVVNLITGTFTPPAEIPIARGQLGLTIQEIVDFSFVFQDPAFLAAMAARGVDTPAELSKYSWRP